MQQEPDREQQVVAEQMEESRKAAAAIKPGAASFDVIVVGSGAAGGMAAFQLATAGIKVLLLEAGRMLDPQKEYRTMEWPYSAAAPAAARRTSARSGVGRVQHPRPAVRHCARDSRSTGS